MKKYLKILTTATFLVIMMAQVGSSQLSCNQGIQVSLTMDPNGGSVVQVVAESLATIPSNYSNLEVSRDGENFQPFIEFDCSDVGEQTYVARALNPNNQEVTCQGVLNVVDLLVPSLDINGPVYLALYDADFVVLSPGMVEVDIFDNCDMITSTLSQTVFQSAGTYPVTYTASDQSGNTASATFDVIVAEEFAMACNAFVQLALDDNGSASVDPLMILEGGVPANGNFAIAIVGEPFTPEISFACDDITTTPVSIVVQDLNNSNQCWSDMVEVEDRSAPLITVPDPLYLSLLGSSSVSLTDYILSDYVSDNCGIASTSLSQSVFDAVGSYEVTYIVVDESSNSSSSTFTVIVTENSILDCNENVNISLDANGQAILTPEILIEGSGSVNGTYEISINGGPFNPTQIVNCEDVGGELQVIIRDSITFAECTSTVIAEDKLQPIPYAQNISVSMEGGNPVTIAPETIDAGSFDNCGIASMTLEPNTFSVPGTYISTFTVFDDSGNSNFATVEITVLQGSGISIECIGASTVEVAPWGMVTLSPADFVLNPEDFEAFTISTSAGGPYTDSVTIDCAMYPTATPFPVFVRGEVGGTFSTCQTQVTLIDNIPPVPVVEIELTLFLIGGTATLTPEDVDDGSYDQCGSITYELSQTEFTEADLGENIITLTVTDESGNYNQTFTTVTVVSPEPCTLQAVLFPDDISITDGAAHPSDLTVQNLQDTYGFTYAEVHPTTLQTCDNLVYAYQDQVIETALGYKIIRTWTAVDWDTTDVHTEVQIIYLFTQSNGQLLCIDELTIAWIDDDVQVYAENVLAGQYNTDVIELLILDQNNMIIQDNVITEAHIGQTLTYTVTDNLSQESCMGTINVIEADSGCPLIFDEDVSLPLPQITLVDLFFNNDNYTPEYLVELFDFDPSEVMVLIDTDCAVVSTSYQDLVVSLGFGTFRIERTFTIIDWNAFDPPSNAGYWEVNQTIVVTTEPASLICDSLPNSAPVGDCESGHTLEDDVEWPSDIMIADYRITPEQLVDFSSVPEIDSKPIFQNSPDNYAASYVDVVVSLTTTTLTIARVWTATHVVYGITWNYTQTIEIDFSEFENLVTVSTIGGRAMPGVTINEQYMTDTLGRAQVLGDVDMLVYDDEVEGNGINVRDAILIHRHVLGIESLSEDFLAAADFTQDAMISTLDLVRIQRAILELETEPNWQFINTLSSNSTGIQPKGEYVAVKLGDVDDSAILQGDTPVASGLNIELEDILLNNGESYQIPIRLSEHTLMMGIEIRLQIDDTKLEVTDVYSDLLFKYLEYHIDQNGLLTIVAWDSNNAYDPSDAEEGAVIYIEATAVANSIMHEAIIVSDRASYLVDSNIELITIGTDIENMIGTGTNSPTLSHVSAYPNPASDFMTIHLGELAQQAYQISVYDNRGQRVLTQQNHNVLNLQALATGQYYYRVDVDGHHTVAPFMVIR